MENTSKSLSNFPKNYRYIQVAPKNPQSFRVMSWNVLAEVYKSGHIKNFKNKMKFNAETRGRQIVSS